jgi:sugar phosphate isomerase/epimerase
VLADAGIRDLLTYVDLARPIDPAAEADCWSGLIGAYEGIARVAETVGVRIGNHSLHRLLPDDLRPAAVESGVLLDDYATYRVAGWGGPFLVDTWERLDRLVRQVDSPANGITLCTGMDILGGDLPALVHRFADRIFFCQIRDHSDGWPAGRELPLGEGRVDLPAVLTALGQVGYTGIVHPEHLGRDPAPGEDRLSDAVGFLRRHGVAG